MTDQIVVFYKEVSHNPLTKEVAELFRQAQAFGAITVGNLILELSASTPLNNGQVQKLTKIPEKYHAITFELDKEAAANEFASALRNASDCAIRKGKLLRADVFKMQASNAPQAAYRTIAVSSEESIPENIKDIFRTAARYPHVKLNETPDGMSATFETSSFGCGKHDIYVLDKLQKTIQKMGINLTITDNQPS